MTVTVGRLALDALAGIEELGAAQPSSRVEGAIRIYLADRDLDRAGWPYPGFTVSAADAERRRVDLDLDGALWRAFTAEAARQRVETDRLVEHAALYLAAEVEGGRILVRMLESTGPAGIEEGA